MTLTNWLLVVIAVLLVVQIIRQEIIMAAIDDLTTAVGGLETAATTIIAKIAALKATPGIDPVAVEGVVARINTVAQNLTAAAQ